VPLTGDKDACTSNNRDNVQRQLSWDKADLGSFYYHTGNQSSPLLMKKTLRETKTLRAGCSKAEPKIFAPPQTPSQGRRTAKI